MDIGANLGCIDNTILFYEDMITNVEREKSNPFAKLLEGRSDNTAAFHHAVPSDSYICQVTTDDAVIHYYCLAVENDVLAAAENGLPAHLIAGRRLDVLGLVVQHLAGVGAVSHRG